MEASRPRGTESGAETVSELGYVVDFKNPVPIFRDRMRASDERGDPSMATYVITHEVDDVEHWLSSPKREEVFGPMGISVRTFRDPGGSNKVALIAEIPDMNAFQEFMGTEEAAEAERYDGVRSQTILVLEESSR